MDNELEATDSLLNLFTAVFTFKKHGLILMIDAEYLVAMFAIARYQKHGMATDTAERFIQNIISLPDCNT